MKFKIAGTERPSREKLSQLTGYPFHSLSTTLLNIKKKKNHVDYDKTSVWLTEAGWNFAQKEYGDQVNTPMDNSSVHATLIEMHNLKGAKLKIFELLKDSKKPKSVEELMEHVNCTNKKSFGTYISALNSASITESVKTENGVKKYQLVEKTCFPMGID
jgi:hypothetical protein